MNPSTRSSLETNQAFQELMRSKDFQVQAAEAFRNPSTLREILQTTDRAVNELKSCPGGIEMITSMYDQLHMKEEESEADESVDSGTLPHWHTA